MDMRTIVFGDRAGATYRAGRTVRALRQAGLESIEIVDRRLDQLACLLDGQQSVWLIRAGTWPVCAGPFPPAASATGRALCALGSIRACAEEPNEQAAAWEQLLAETGGDFALASDLGTRLPSLASVFLDARLAGCIGRRLHNGEDVGTALAAEIGSGRYRVVHYPALDVHNDAKLRVVQLVTSLQRGGAERIALNLTRELGRQGVRCLLATLGQPSRDTFDLPAGVIDLAARISRRADRFPALTRMACRIGADLIHAHLLDGEEVARLALGGHPLVVTVHNTRPGWPPGLDTLKAGDLLVGCALAVEAELRALGLPMPLRSAWNGIDFKPLVPTSETRAAGRQVRARLGIASDDVVLLALANPRPQKRLHLLPAVLAVVRAELQRRCGDTFPTCSMRVGHVGNVSPQGRDACLVLAGETARLNAAATQALEQVRAEVARLGLQQRVHWTGAVADVTPILAAADVLVSTSGHEGLSLAQVEGLAAGLPLVITDVGGAAELARDNPAVTLVSPECAPENMAAAIVDQVLRGQHDGDSADVPCPGPSVAVRNFSTARMAERYAWLYPRVLTPRGRRGTGLWLVTNNFSTGGAQSSARRLLLGLREAGVAVRAAVLQEWPQYPTPGREALREAGIHVLALPPAGSIDTAIAVARLLDAIDHDLPEAVLLWNVIPEYKVLLADALLDVPVFDVSPGEMYFTSLETYFARPRPGLPYLSLRDYGRRLAGVIVKFHAEAARAAELGAPVHVIANGVPLDELAPLAPGRDGCLTIGTAVRLAPHKKLEDLVEALRLAESRLPPHVLRIAGGVETGAEAYAEELRRRAAGLHVEWLGEVRDVRPFLGQLDLFALVAEPAGCPNASLEAMAAGLPVVITNVGGAGEQVEDGVSGRVVPARDPSALAEALVELAHDPGRRALWGAAGHARARTYFGLPAMVANYRRVCLGNGKA